MNQQQANAVLGMAIQGFKQRNSLLVTQQIVVVAGNETELESLNASAIFAGRQAGIRNNRAGSFPLEPFDRVVASREEDGVSYALPQQNGSLRFAISPMAAAA